MKKIGILYGSSEGNTESVAKTIASKLGVDSADVHDVAKANAEDASNYDVLLLGCSTWGAGDMQDDWYDFLPKLQKIDLSGKLVALFGCGDSASFSDTFCGALGTLRNDLASTGCSFIGEVDASEYTYDDSDAVSDGKFCGLPIDEVNESDKTEERIDSWLEQLKSAGLE